MSEPYKLDIYSRDGDTPRIWAEWERFDYLAAKLYSHENDLWCGRAQETWNALSDEEREAWREKLRQHLSKWEAMPRPWKDEHDRLAWKRTLATNEREFRRISSKGEQ